MELTFTYESGGIIKTKTVQVNETGLTFNYSVLQSWGAISPPTETTRCKWSELSGVKYYVQEKGIGTLTDPYTKYALLPSAINAALLPYVNWNDSTYQWEMESGMDNFVGDNFTYGSYKIVHCGAGCVGINFGLTTIHEGGSDIPAFVNSGIAYLNPTEYPEGGQYVDTLIVENTGSNYGVLNDTYSRRPNLMFLLVSIHDDIVSSETYGEDFDVIIVLRSKYDVTPPNCYSEVCFIDKRLFGEGQPVIPPAKSTTQGNTPNGFRGGRDDHSDSDTESHVGDAISSYVNYGNHGTRLYRLGSGNVEVLYECLWSDSFWDKWNNAKWNPLSGLLALQAMPCEPDATFTLTQEVYACGKRLDYTPDLGQTVITYGDVPDKSTAELKTKTFYPLEYSHSFLDWGGYTSVKFRLPFIGIVPVDVSKIMEGGIFAKYNIDFLTGNCLVQIYTVPSKEVMGTEGDWDEDYGGCLCMIAQYAGNCAHKLNISGTDFGGSQVMGSVVSSIMSIGTAAIGAVSGIVAPEAALVGGALSVIGNTAKASMAQHHNQVIPATPNADTMGMLVPALIIERPIDITPLDENGSATPYEFFNGRPAASGGQVKDYKSFDTGEGIFIKGILHADTLYAAEDEKRQIEKAFAKGVYL